MFAMTVDLEKYFIDYPEIFKPHSKEDDELVSKPTF